MRRKRSAYRRRRRSNPDYSKHPIVRQIVGQLHVGASDAEAEELMRSKLTGKATEAQRKAIVRGAIKAHKKNRDQYAWVMGGGHGYKGRKARGNPQEFWSQQGEDGKYYVYTRTPSSRIVDLTEKPGYDSKAQADRWVKIWIDRQDFSPKRDDTTMDVRRHRSDENPAFRGSFDKAKKQAQANADRFAEPFVLFRDSSGNLRVERTATAGTVAMRDGIVFRPNVSGIRRAATGYGHLANNSRRRAYRGNPRRRYAIKQKGGSRWWGNRSSSPHGFDFGWTYADARNQYESKAVAGREAHKVGGEVYEVFPYFPPMKAFKRSRRNPRKRKGSRR